MRSRSRAGSGGTCYPAAVSVGARCPPCPRAAAVRLSSVCCAPALQRLLQFAGTGAGQGFHFPQAERSRTPGGESPEQFASGSTALLGPRRSSWEQGSRPPASGPAAPDCPPPPALSPARPQGRRQQTAAGCVFNRFIGVDSGTESALHGTGRTGGSFPLYKPNLFNIN